MTPSETAAQLRLAADWIEKNMSEKTDPYAELKKAHAEGKVIEFKPKAGNFLWVADPFPEWADHMDYRIKPDEIPWIEWHGGPCPLRDEEVEKWEYRLRDGSLIPSNLDVKPSTLSWVHYKYGSDIIAYRVLKWREKKPKVPLGPDDVPPGSVLLSVTAAANGMRWTMATCSKNDGVEINGRLCIPWEELKTHWKINRSIPFTGKWNPDAWEACEQ